MATLVNTIADFQTTLASKVAIGGTTATLISATDDDGVALPTGKYGLTIDRKNSSKEYITCTITGTSITNVKTIARGTGAETTGFAKTHRKGAEVIISDFVAIKRLQDVLETGYGTPTTPTTDYQLATKKYVDDLAFGGATTVDSLTVVGLAGESVSAGDVVYLKEADGYWWKCDADTLTTLSSVQIGIAQGAGTATNSITNGVLIQGVDTNQSGGTGGAFGYISNTPGAVSTSAGTNPAIIGQFKSVTDFYFNPVFYGLPTSNEKGALTGTSGTPSSSNKYVTNDDTSASGSGSKIPRGDGTGKIAASWFDSAKMPIPSFQQSFPAVLGSGLDTGICSTSDSDGAVFYLCDNSGNLQRYERDTITGMYTMTHYLNPTFSISGDNPAMIKLGSYIYLFGSDNTNVNCARFLAADFTGETNMTVPVLACGSRRVDAWTDGTFAYVVSGNSSTTSNKWSVSGTTFTASSTASISISNIASGSPHSNFFDGTNAYVGYFDGGDTIAGAAGTVSSWTIWKITTLDGTVYTTTKKYLNQFNTGGTAFGGSFLIYIDSNRMYIGTGVVRYNATTSIATDLILFPVSKP